MRNALELATGLVLGAITLGGDARACGGCFHPPTADSVVTGHRMAFAVSENRTVLWDQIKYSGNPSDFGWVLPVAPGATIEASTDAWFEALDSATTVSVTAPPLNCATPGSSGCGFISSSDSLSSSGGSFAGNGVTVLHEGTVGSFETATLRSTDGASLRTWLSNHGYVVAADINPIIDAYVSEGADFIALQLLPGLGVNQMTPVRVVTPSGRPILPLRMVAAGTGSSVDIVLFVIGEKRFGLKDLTEVHVDAITYDFAKGETNYLTLRQRALADSVGANFLTTFAATQPFTRTPSSGGFQVLSPSNSFGSSGFASNLADLYFQQAFSNAGRTAGGAPSGNICPATVQRLDSADLVTDATAAGGLWCDVYDDFAAAELGMHPSRVWLTRLEMTLPREALAMDCNVAPATSQEGVSNQLVAVRSTNRPSYCQEPIFESRVARERTSPASAVAWAMAALGLVALLRRARGRS
jgi:hypothetical protein